VNKTEAEAEKMVGWTKPSFLFLLLGRTWKKLRWKLVFFSAWGWRTPKIFKCRSAP